MYELGKSDAKISVAVGLLALVFAFLVLFAMSFVGSSPSGTSPLARLRRPRAVPKEPAA
jgi:putative spermidine/putrescine transport system permease protein